MTGKRKRGTAYNNNPTKTNKRNKRASGPKASPHPHGDIDEDVYYKVRTVLNERTVRKRVEYLIDWEDNEATGEKYAPTWEPRSNLTEAALADWEASKSAKQADEHPKSSNSVEITQATPLRNPVQCSRIRRVLSSSSVGQSSPTTGKNLITTPITLSRPIEIRESPEVAPVEYDRAGSPLFEPQDNGPEIPSQDLAFVRPSEPPSSYQNYTEEGSSEIRVAGDKLTHSRRSSESQQIPDIAAADSTKDPLVLATSQDIPSQPPVENSTGRVVPDSQSFGLVSQIEPSGRLNNDEEATNQFVEDLQVAASAPPSTTLGRNISTTDLSQPIQGVLQHHKSQSPTAKGTEEIAVGLPEASYATQPLQSTRELGGEEVQGQSLKSSPTRLTGNDSQTSAASRFSIQIDHPGLVEERALQLAAPEERPTTLDQSTTDTATDTSFPFETQIAAQTPPRPLALSYSQPNSGRRVNLPETTPRANSLPVLDETLSSPFPTAPSQVLPGIGVSAPPLPYLSSTPVRSSIEEPETMDRKIPTSEPKIGMVAKIQALKAEQAIKRGRAPSATPGQTTPVKPSAVPPRLNAELAAEKPTQTGSPDSSHNGARSPSAVPAALPLKAITQEEMNTSGRYKTLVPQEKENPMLRRQSTITGTISKEVSKSGNIVHSVPIALMGHQRDSYPLMIQHHKDTMDRFLNTDYPSDELNIEIETLLDRLRRIVVHPDLDNIETYTQYDVPPAAHAKWAIDCSAKFHFLKHLIDELRDKPVSIAVICQSGQLLHILENFLLGFNVSWCRADTGQTADHSSSALNFKIMSANEDASLESLTVDAVICMDGSAEAGGSTLKLLQERPDRELVMMTLVVPGTIEHVERCLSPNLTQQQRLRALVHGVFDLRYVSGKLEHGQLPSVETAKVIADFLTSEPSEREWSVAALSMLENLDSETQTEPLQSSETALQGEKRTINTSGLDMPDSTTYKRPRLASNGIHQPHQPTTINPLELELSHVSDSLERPSQQANLDTSSLDNSSDLNETINRLQSLLLEAQASLTDHKRDLSELQYRHEDQRNQLVELTRKNEEAVDMAQKAVARMTEGVATTNTLRVENRTLKEQLKAAQETLGDHSIPERAELEKQRLAFEQSQSEVRVLEKRLRTQQSDLDYAQEMYQNSSSAAQRLGTTNRELENALSHAQNRANGEQARAKQMTLDARAANLVRENRQLKAKVREQTDALARKDKELSLLKEASRGRMSTRGSSVPRSPRMGSPLKNAAGSRQSSPSASDLRGKTHPLRQG